MSEQVKPIFEKRVRIVSNGEAFSGTHVYDADTGNELAVTRIEFVLDCQTQKISKVTLTCVAGTLEYEGVAQIVPLTVEQFARSVKHEE